MLLIYRQLAQLHTYTNVFFAFPICHGQCQVEGGATVSFQLIVSVATHNVSAVQYVCSPTSLYPQPEPNNPDY